VKPALPTSLLLGAAALVCLSGCPAPPAGTGTGTNAASAVTKLKGGGSTFVGPMMDEWAKRYKKEKGVTIDYTRGGSGMGIGKMSEKDYDFGCTDMPMNDKERELAKGKGGAVVHIPLVMGALVPAYNLDVAEPIKFRGSTLARIYLGQIKKWNDVELQADNPGVNLPDKEIVVVRRSDPSGSTFIWTSFLSKSSPAWKEQVGANKEVKWPEGFGVGAPKTDGVADVVKRTPGSLGYLEVDQALQKELKFGLVRNRGGTFVSGDKVEAVTAAAAALKDINDDLTFVLVDADGPDVYPICGAVWAVLYEQQDKPEKAQGLKDFLRWATHEGQQDAAKLKYAPLPESLVKRIDQKLETIK
jgi:phosphate ABC transporter phosphate-binding protein